MQEVLEKILERLEREARFYNSASDTDQNIRKGVCISKKIVQAVAEEYNGGWIPCSEMLPDDFMSFEYLTIRKGHTLATIAYYCVVNHKWYLSRNSSKEIEVIAWQPLPEPYKK